MGLAKKASIKHRLVLSNQWAGRSAPMGRNMEGVTVGFVGLGGIGRATLKILRSFDVATLLVHDLFLDAAEAARLQVKLCPLEEVLSSADFVSLHCLLNDHTRGLIAAPQLRQMKQSAYLINTARGEIVDEAALLEALQHGQIAGAAVDCFEVEPLREPRPFAQLSEQGANVLTAGHCIARTDDLFRDIGRSVRSGMARIATGQ